MATQSQLNTTTQSYRNIHIKIDVLDFNYYILDEISGLATSAQFSINADSDIRRSCTVNMILKDEYSNNALDSEIYWKAGNPFWFDKYLKISIGIEENTTGDIIWNNQGVYLINEPSIKYNALTNELYFEGVDLMARLTGLRDGNLEGLDYIIEVGTNVTSAIKDILRQQNFTEYIVLNPPQSVTPYEIKINAGGTAYDLLKELRDINIDWEMFFDVDGVFHFQPIPSASTPDVNIIPHVTKEILDVVDIDLSLDTSFGEVKNYVEVYGGTIQADKTATLVGLTSYNFGPMDAIVKIERKDLENLDENGIYYSVTIGDLSKTVDFFKCYGGIDDVTCVDENNNHIVTGYNTIHWLHDNQSYIFKLYKSNGKVLYKSIGCIQPIGIAWDNNIDSPFYVGNNVNMWEIDKIYNMSDLCYYDNRYYISKRDDNYNNIPPLISWHYGGDEWWRPIYELDSSNGCISTAYNKPKFERQVRIVLSGGEYDNIYSDELAIQRAKYEIYLRSRRHDKITLMVVPIYWLDVNQIIEYQLPNEEKPSYWLVKEVSTDFSENGVQTINAIRYYTGQ